MNRASFFDAVRATVFAGKLNQGQVQGMDAILDEWTAQGLTDTRWLAYMLGTAFHETGKTMQPIREAYAQDDEQAIRILEKAFLAGKLKWVKTPYWRKDAENKSWFGRGLVQLTHRANYEKFGLADHPEKALEMGTAVKVMYIGMINGMFTGKKLADYFRGGKADWVKARQIINGLDCADMVAGYGKKFYAAIEAAR